jgi:hypothetical protein
LAMKLTSTVTGSGVFSPKWTGPMLWLL